MAKFIFVTGGVVSSLGKGITAASLGHLLKARGYKVTMQKMDPYLPGIQLHPRVHLPKPHLRGAPWGFPGRHRAGHPPCDGSHQGTVAPHS